MEDKNIGRFSGITGGEDYDLFKLSSPQYDLMLDKSTELLADHLYGKTQEYFRVLEIGAGTGLLTYRTLLADSRIRLWSIDNELQMVNVLNAKNFASEAKLSVVLCDALSFCQDWPARMLNQSSEPVLRFDAVVSSWTIRNFQPDYRAKVLEQIGNIMKPGGIFINCDKIDRNDEFDHSQDLSCQMDALEIFRTVGRDDLTEIWKNHYLEDENIRISEDEMEIRLVSSGFENIDFRERHVMDAICTAVKI